MKTPWDKYLTPNDRDDPYAFYGAWERWMADLDDRDAESSVLKQTDPGIMELIEDMSMRITLYDRMCGVANGEGTPWHVRLWDVLTEPIVVASWRLYHFRQSVIRDTREIVRSIRAGRWPHRSEHGSWVVYRRDSETGLPVVSCYRGRFWWQRLFPWPRSRGRA